MSDERSIYSANLHLGNNKVIMIPPGDIVELYTVQDVFAFNIFGKLKWTDRRGLFADGQISGNEGFVLEFQGLTSSQSKQVNFLVFKVERVLQGATASPMSGPLLEMTFVDPTFFYLTQRRYSKSWNQKSIDTIISDIYRDMLGIDLDEYKNTDMFESAEESGMPFDFVMPFWTPLVALKYLSQLAGGYCIWPHVVDDSQTPVKVGKLTLQHLFAGVPYNMTAPRAMQNLLTFEAYKSNTTDVIKDWWLKGIDKFNLKFIRGGKYLGFDFDGKRFLEKQYTYVLAKNVPDQTDVNNVKQDWIAPMGHQSILGKKSLFPNISDLQSYVKLTGLGDAEYEYPDYLKPLGSLIRSEWSSRYNTQNTLTVILEGRDTRHPGMWVNVEAPGVSVDGSVTYNPQLKGDYIIKNLITVFVGFGLKPYSHVCELMRNGYDDSKDTSLEDSDTGAYSQ